MIVYIYMYDCKYVYMYAYVCIYIYILHPVVSPQKGWSYTPTVGKSTIVSTVLYAYHPSLPTHLDSENRPCALFWQTVVFQSSMH